MIQNEYVDTSKIINRKMTSSGSSNIKVDDDSSSFKIVKDLVKRKGFGDDSSIMNLIRYIKEIEINDCSKRLLKLINMDVDGSRNFSYERLIVEEKVLKKISFVALSSYSNHSKCDINIIVECSVVFCGVLLCSVVLFLVVLCCVACVVLCCVV